MHRVISRSGAITVAGAAALVLSLTACSGSSTSGSSGGSLVVDNAFDLKTVDPARSFEHTGTVLDMALYQTTLKFTNTQPAKPVPELASYTMSDQNKVLTLKMTKGAKFSDGSSVTADDVVFSYQRLQGINGNPAFLLAGVTVKKVDANTVTLTSKTANPQLPAILPNPSLGIVEAKVVKKHGGNTTSHDGAQHFLDNVGAGSGPYMIDSYNPSTQVVLKANPHYNGPKPTFSRVVVRNVKAATQLIDVQSGTANLAMDLSPDQIKSLDRSKVKVASAPSTYSLYMFMNKNPSINKFTSNPSFVKGVKEGVDVDKLVQIAGTGAKRLGGIVPTVFLGSLPASQGLTYNQAAAKADIKASGYNGSTIPFYFPDDVTLGGINFQDIAESIQSQLKSLGVTIALRPGPSATAIDPFRAGKDAMGMWYWGSDYPDPGDYLEFAPGGGVGIRAQWTTKNADATVQQDLAAATSAVSSDQRAAAYRTLQTAFNTNGPFVPLFQPADNIVTGKPVKSVVLNPASTFDFAEVK